MEKLLRAVASRILKAEKARGQFDIIFADDKTVRILNRKYRKIDRATDVLSFPMEDKDFLGDVIISCAAAKRNAKRYNVSYDDELKRMVIHGMLHLLGYDHIKKRDREIMRKKEEKYLKI